MERPRRGVWVPGPHPSLSQSCVLVIACHHHMSLLLLFVVGGDGVLAAVRQWWVGPRSLLVVRCWCGVPCWGSRVVVGIPFREGGGWLCWRALVACGHSMMVVWWVLEIVVVVLHVVEGGGHLSPIIVKGGHIISTIFGVSRMGILGKLGNQRSTEYTRCSISIKSGTTRKCPKHLLFDG